MAGNRRQTRLFMAQAKPLYAFDVNAQGVPFFPDGDLDFGAEDAKNARYMRADLAAANLR